MNTQLKCLQVKLYTLHHNEEVRHLAIKWLDYYREVEKGVSTKTNILKPAARLLTVDSQLKYLLEEEN